MEDLSVTQDRVARYFAGEKRDGAVVLAAGVLSGAVAVWVSSRAPTMRGLILPSALGAVIQLALGWVTFTRATGQARDARETLTSDAAAFRARECERLAFLRRSYRLYKTVELVLLAAAVGLALVYADVCDVYWAAVGLGLEAGFMLAFDLWGERRAVEYQRHVRPSVNGAEKTASDPAPP